MTAPALNLAERIEDVSALRRVIDRARVDAGCGLAELTALSPQNDPYRIDTPANHTVGKWFAEQMERLGLVHRKLHLRGIHYALLGSTAMPTGELYANTGECWDWLQDQAAKAARWLGYVPFDAITDARNAAPVIRIHERSAIETFVSVEPDIILPSIEDLAPRVSIRGFEGRQPYRLAFYGEKTSLEPILAPIADRYQADLFLPTGEISDTQLHAMAAAGANDGRRLVVFVLADFDPSGAQMAVSIGRKLQALRDLLFPQLRFSLYAVALNAEQVREFDLPSTPLKETERRASRWREAHDGLEQTEIDALATLRPDLLRQIVTEAVDPFFDRTLASRVFEAKGAWLDQARAALEQLLGTENMLTLRAHAERQIESIRAQLREIETSTQMATADLEFELPDPEIPPAEIDVDLQPQPLVSSDWDWVDQTRALIARKRYEGGR
jgi:hypothetical protein